MISTTLSLTMMGVTNFGPLPVPIVGANSRSSMSTSPSTLRMPFRRTCRASDAGRPADRFGQFRERCWQTGVGVIAVLEDELAFGVGAAAQRGIALGHEDEVAVEGSLDEFATPVDRRTKAMIGSERDQSGGAGVELGDGGRSEQVVVVVPVDGLPESASTTRSPIGCACTRAAR